MPLQNPVASPAAGHVVPWPDETELAAVADQLARRPPLVDPRHCDRLRRLLARAARGEAFLLQGGDCAETFAANRPAGIAGRMSALSDAAAILGAAFELPVVRVGRIAGQYAKPRSQPTEWADGVELPSYRGDMVNGFGATVADRTPDPKRLLAAYTNAQQTLAVCATIDPHDFWTSHEALVLAYERALTRTDPETNRFYNLSAHTVWVGNRTRQLDGDHLAHLASIANPVAVKVDASTSEEDIVRLIDLVDPNREPGRLTLITRMGAKRIRADLPRLVSAVQQQDAHPLWVCDPMHGNTYLASVGLKTRQYEVVRDETIAFFEIHRDMGSHPGGLHLEFTDEHVTECVGGPEHLTESDLPRRYTSACDPRLNITQTRDLIATLARLFAAARPQPSQRSAAMA